MNNLEAFSLSSNLSISSPYLQRDYFPIDIDLSKAILILNTFEDPRKQSRVYDYFQDVIDFSYQELATHGYFFFQPLTGKENVLRCRNSNFNLTPNQIAYLIDNCALVIGNDNLYSHVANESGIKNIAVFGPSSTISHSPKFNNGFIAIRECKTNPSYRSVEFPKSVNENKPEIIINAIYSSLEIKKSAPLTSLYFGENYPTSVIQIVPDSIINPENFKNNDVLIRMDYLFNEEILSKTLENRKCNIISTGEINLDLLKRNKGNINIFIYEINLNVDISYIKNLIKTGVKVKFISKEDGDKLSKLRMKMFDFGLVEKDIISSIPKDVLRFIGGNTYYRSNNFILSDGKIYSTHTNYLKNKPIQSFTQNIMKLDVLDPSFNEILPFASIFNLNS